MYRKFSSYQSCRPSLALRDYRKVFASPPIRPTVPSLHVLRPQYPLPPTRAYILRTQYTLGSPPPRSKITSNPIITSNRCTPLLRSPLLSHKSVLVPRRDFTLKSEFKKAWSQFVSNSQTYLHKQTALWLFWFRARWYNKVLSVLFILFIVLFIFTCWDTYFSFDSPFGVVRRTVQYLQTDPEFSETLGTSLRWYLTDAYAGALLLPAPDVRWFKNVHTGSMLMHLRLWVVGKRRARIEVIMEETTWRHFECFSIQVNYDGADTITRTRMDREGKHLF